MKNSKTYLGGAEVKHKIQIDVGETFNDFLLAHEDGTTQIYKVLSAPDDPSIGLIKGREEMARDRNSPLQKFIKEVDIIVHGTTVMTNAVFNYPGGAKTGLVTIRRARDALEVRRASARSSTTIVSRMPTPSFRDILATLWRSGSTAKGMNCPDGKLIIQSRKRSSKESPMERSFMRLQSSSSIDRAPFLEFLELFFPIEVQFF